MNPAGGDGKVIPGLQEGAPGRRMKYRSDDNRLVVHLMNDTMNPELFK
jgi:hypothetical protein